MFGSTQKIIGNVISARLRFLITFFVITGLLVGGFTFNTTRVSAAFNKQINYQGKLTDSGGTAVANGTYRMKFSLYTALTGGSNIWQDDRSAVAGDRIAVSNGLFSAMLGSSTPLTSVDFNQTLYLGLEVCGLGSGAESCETLTPRKILGAVPAAFEADRVDGLSSEQFLRTDASNSTSTASTFLSFFQTGAGKIAEFFGQNSSSVFNILSGGNVGIGTTTPYAKLSVVGDVVASNFVATTSTASIFPYASTTALTVSGTNGLTLGSLNGPLQANNGAVSATSSIGVLYGGSGLTTAPSYGNLLVGNSSGGYTLTSTSSLNIAFSNLVGTLGISQGGTGQTSFGQGWLGSNGTTITSSTSPTVNYVTATSTSVASSFIYASTTALTVSGNAYFPGPGIWNSSGNVGVGTSTPYARLSIWGPSSTSGILASFVNNASTSIMTILNSGRVGVGTNFDGTNSGEMSSFLTFPTTVSLQQNRTVGFTFKVNSPITVSRLGRAYLAGTPENHLARIWDSGSQGSPLTSGTILAASASDSNNFKWVSVTPVRLVPGTTYAIGIDESSSGTDAWRDVWTPSFQPVFTDITIAYTNSGANGYPTLNSAGVYSNQGIIYDSPAMGFAYDDLPSILTTKGTTTDATGYSFVANNSAGYPSLVVSNTGHVGVGTTSPTSNFTVAGSVDYNTLSSRRFVYDGDSITTELDAVFLGEEWPKKLRAIDPFVGVGQNTNVATNGEYVADVLAGYTAQVHPYRPLKNSDEAYYLVIAGTNDAINVTFNATTVYNSLKTLWAGARTDGFKVVASTIPTTAYAGGNGAAGNDANRVALNTLILSDMSLYDYLARPDVWMPNPLDLTYFNADLLHPNATGNAMIAQNIKNILHSQFNSVATTGAFGGVATSSSVGLVVLSGNVGIGTTSPYAKLSIQGATSTPGTASLFAVASSTNETLFTILGNGNVGIGTTSPYAKLSVAGQVVASYFTATSTTATSTFAGFIDVNGTGSNATSTFASNLWVKGTLRTGTGSMYLNDTSLSSANGNLFISNTAASYFNGGNFGIGTTTPGTTLSLGNTGANTVNISTTATSTFGSGINISTGCFAVNNVCVGGSGGGSGTVGSGATGQFPYYSGAGTTLAATSSIFLATTGNVGLGTTTPWGVLSVGTHNATTTVPSFVIASSSTGVATTTQFVVLNGNVGVGTTTPWGMLSINPNGISGPSFVIGSSTRTDLIVTNGGLVGIGSTTPTAKLSVRGVGATTGWNFQTTNSSNVALFSILDNGRVGIGTTTPQSRLTIQSSTSDTSVTRVAIPYDVLSNIGDAADNPGTQSYGYYFSVPTEISVKQLGRYSSSVDGGNHVVNIWDMTSQTVVAVGTVLNSATPDANGFKYIAITPVTLYPSKTYAILVDELSGGDPFFASTIDTSTFFSSHIKRLGLTYGNGGPSTYPTSFFGGVTLYNLPTLKYTVPIIPQASFAYDGFTESNLTTYSNGNSVFALTANDSSFGFLAGVAIGKGAVTTAVADVGTILDIAGNVKITGGLGAVKITDGSNNFTMQPKLANSGNSMRWVESTYLAINAVTGGNLLFNLDSTGVKTGVSTSSPWGTLSVSTPLQQSGTIPLFVVGSTTNATLFNVMGNGNVGIGTTTPVANLGMQGSLGVNTSQLYLASTGNVGVGTTTPWRTLSVTGTVGFDGLSATGLGDTFICISANKELRTGATCASSSETIKENITGLTHGLDWLNELHPVSFKYKDGYYGGIQDIGLIAEQVASVDPRLALYGRNGEVLNINERGILSVTVKSLQEMAQRISFDGAPTNSPSITINSSGNIGIGTATSSLSVYKLDVNGDVRAHSFVASGDGFAGRNQNTLNESDFQSTFADKIRALRISSGFSVITEDAPSEILTASGDVDVYKLATFTLSGVKAQQLQLESLVQRIAAVELAVGLGGDFTATSTSSIMTSLENLGTKITQGLAQFKNIITGSLTIGSADKPSGITLYDEKTGEPYCVKVVGGKLKNISGTCEDARKDEDEDKDEVDPPITTEPPVVVDSTDTTTPPVVENHEEPPKVDTEVSETVTPEPADAQNVSPDDDDSDSPPGSSNSDSGAGESSSSSDTP